jgi:hypothetical protein
MPRKGGNKEEIVHALHQVEGGEEVTEVCRRLGVSDHRIIVSLESGEERRLRCSASTRLPYLPRRMGLRGSPRPPDGPRRLRRGRHSLPGARLCRRGDENYR